MGPFRWTLRATNVYEEYEPMLKTLQAFGVVPFALRSGKPQATKLHVLYFAVQTCTVLYCLYDSKSKDLFSHISKYTLSTIVYDVVSVTGSLYSIISLARYLFRHSTCIRIWENISEITRELSCIAENVCRRKTLCLIKTASLLLAFFGFTVLTFRLQTNKSRLTWTFWAVYYIPLFQSCLVEAAFNTYCMELRRKFSIANDVLTRDLQDSSRRNLTWRRVRVLRKIHFKAYETTKDMDSLYGLHFLYVFVSNFINATLDFCNIIRLHASKNPSSVVRFKSAVYWTTHQVLQVLNIVFSGVVMRTEVRKMNLLVHEHLILADDRNSRLKLELESFSLQLMQCPLNFTAAGFFQLDCALLIQLGVAVLSNSLFFVQIDKLKKRG